MPKRISRHPQMTENQLQKLFSEIKPIYQIDEQWLSDQRFRLMGALEVAEEGHLLRRIGERLSLWWEELPYMWVAARPTLALVSAALVGILVGRFLLMAPGAPGAPLMTIGETAAPQMNLAEMIRAGQVKGIDVGLSDDPDNPVELHITTGHEMRLTGSAEREDILAALEYVLVKDPNPGQRLQSARILGNTSRLGEKKSTIMALVSALLTDENPGVRISVIKSLRGEGCWWAESCSGLPGLPVRR